jgi:hypothetical protein
MRTVVRHWWNAKWGRLVRRDLYVRTDGRRWEVEARIGGAEGRSRRQVCHNEDEALALARRWLALGGSDWTDVTSAHRPRQDRDR